MRIALIGPFAPFRGGIAQFNDRLLQELESRSHRVLPLTFSRQYPDFLFPGTSQLDPSRSGSAEPIIDSLNPISWRKAGRRIREFGADVAVSAYWTPHLAPALAGVLQTGGAAGIGLVHNMMPHDGGALSKPLGRYFLKRLQGALTLSEAVSLELEGLGFSKPVETTPHPVYDHFGEPIDQKEARRTLGLPESDPILLCLGLVRPYKGFELALDAMPTILKTLPDAKLVIAGEAYDSALAVKLSQLPALSGVVRRDDRYIPDAEVPLYYSAADALILPYRRATQSGALAAAAHFGLPVVVTDVGGLADPVRKYEMGAIAEDHSQIAIAKAVLEVLSSENREQYRVGSRRMAKEATWAVLCDKLELLITKIR
ncbi:MAG: D-inositol-3-phosphate glycosyltransferase [Rhodothermales bacterium]|jgi:D-inositol-3-phosphate glycosyltransferase